MSFKRIINKFSGSYRWGVVLIDFPMGSVMNSDYYSSRFKSEKEAHQWCDFHNNPHRDDGCFWTTRRRENTENNTEPSIDPWRGNKPLDFPSRKV